MNNHLAAITAAIHSAYLAETGRHNMDRWVADGGPEELVSDYGHCEEQIAALGKFVDSLSETQLAALVANRCAVAQVLVSIVNSAEL